MLTRSPTPNESGSRRRVLVSVVRLPVGPLADRTAPPRPFRSPAPPPTPAATTTSSVRLPLSPYVMPRRASQSSPPPQNPSLSFPSKTHTPSHSTAPPSVSPFSTASVTPTFTRTSYSPVSSSSLSSPPPLPVPPPLPTTSTYCGPPHPSSSPRTSAVCSDLPSSSVCYSPPPPVPAAPRPTAPPTPYPPCSCSTLLPRLLSAHRLEMRRLLRGALSSLGRRLDALERNSRRKRRKRAIYNPDASSPTAACSTSSSSHPVAPPSTSHSRDSHTPAPPFCLNRSERTTEEAARGTKRRRKRREPDEDGGPAGSVGPIAVPPSGKGAKDAAPLNLRIVAVQQSGKGESGQSEEAVSVVGRQNGYRASLLLQSSAPSLQLLPAAANVQPFGQSEAFRVASGQWRFSDSAPPFSFSPAAFLFCMRPSSSSSSSSFSPASMLRLSAASVDTLTDAVRGGTFVRPLRSLRDWTAPPSLSRDHCYVQKFKPSAAFSARRQQKQRTNHSARKTNLPRRQPLALPPCSANGLSAPLPANQSQASSEFFSTKRERGKRVSQIRIRRASPKETLLTPMGLPKVKRVKKKEFSLEEIYTNKNFNHLPTTNRSLETIFEEPREKDGALLLIGHQRRRRVLLFPDFTQPRKRKRSQGAGLPIVLAPRKRAAARRNCSSDDDPDLDVMLVERLSALEHYLTQQGLDV